MIPDTLVDEIQNGRVILFAGAGLSVDLGLPPWEGLIDFMAAELGYDPPVFKRHGDFLQLAEYFKLKKTVLGALRSQMDRTWHINVERIDTSRAHQAILNLKFATIYTTNFDRWLEIAFQRRGIDFVKIANVGDFAKSRPGVIEIVKFHGDFDDDSSLVLTESSYFDRLSFESPLDLKLRVDVIGKTVLFIGYSLSDINIRYLLYKVHRLWADSDFSKTRPGCFILLNRPNPIQEKILMERGITPIVEDSKSPGEALSGLLEELAFKAFGWKPSAAGSA